MYIWIIFSAKNGEKKIFEFVLSEMDKYKGKPIILMGDFNTGKPFIDEIKNTFYRSQYMNIIE